MLNRLIEVSIEDKGTLYSYSDAYIKVSITKQLNWVQDKCQVTIANISNKLLTPLLKSNKPWPTLKEPRIIIVKAGTDDSAVQFNGNINTVQVEGNTDKITTIKAYATDLLNYQHVNLQSKKSTLSAVVKQGANAFNTMSRFLATDVEVQSFSLNGNFALFCKKLSQYGKHVAVIDNILTITDKGYVASASFLADSTNIIGRPELDEKGIKVRVLFANNIAVGNTLKVKSLNPAATGTYKIYNLDYDLATREKEWYVDIKGSYLNGYTN